MTAYYNEFDPFAAQWLRNLIKAGLIAPGDVDERSITEVTPDDLRGYTQCHFFAGIGGWPLAARLAGWTDDRPIWTGSCPCQPFSTAGKQRGTDDERHLWPVWSNLIRECRPATVFGEQVEGAVKHGWLDIVFDDLETIGYSCGAGVLPACSVGAPHIRQRLWFVADSDQQRRDRKHAQLRPEPGNSFEAAGSGTASLMANANANDKRLEGWRGVSERADQQPARASSVVMHQCRDGKARPIPIEPSILTLLFNGLSHRMGFGSYENKEGEIDGQKGQANTAQALQGMQRDNDKTQNQRAIGRFNSIQDAGVLQPNVHGKEHGRADNNPITESQQKAIPESEKGFLRALWADSYKQPAASCASQGLQPNEQRDWEFADLMLFLSSAYTQADEEGSEGAKVLHSMWEASKKAGVLSKALSAIEEVWQSVADKEENWRSQLRDCERHFRRFARFPLAANVPNRVGLLRGAGNAIVPQVASEVIAAFMEYAA